MSEVFLASSSTKFASKASLNNTLRLPCLSERFYCVSEKPKLIELLSQWPETLAPLVVGEGSNLILPPKISRPVLQLQTKVIAYEPMRDCVLVHAEAGVNWDHLVGECVAKGLRGIENLSLIPGTVGAAPVQNIGAYGVELKDALVSVDVFDFESRDFYSLTNSECEFAYRDSLFKRHPGRFTILGITLSLSHHKPFKLDYGELAKLEKQSGLEASDVRHAVIAVRKAKLPDPDKLPNAGSFFKNPVVDAQKLNALKQLYPELVAFPWGQGHYKLAAAWLIDQAGWKGKKGHKVSVHDKQALVLVNTGSATQDDILSFAEEIKADIGQRYDVCLEIEPVTVFP